MPVIYPAVFKLAIATSFSFLAFCAGTVSFGRPSDGDGSGNSSKPPFAFDDAAAIEQECLSALEHQEEVEPLIKKLESNYKGQEIPEAIRMLSAILRGSQMGYGEGWFGPAKQRYDWTWMAERHEILEDMSLDQDEFKGDTKLFTRLDRNGDSTLDASDLNWGEDSEYLHQLGIATQVFRRMDKSKDSKVSREELVAFFDRVRGDQEEMSLDSFRRSLSLGSTGGGYLPGDAPTPFRLLKGFFNSEVGSWQEGPAIGETAPDFELTTQDGEQVVHLKEWFGKKPIVLIFGNFTCGPFRRNYPEVDAICQRYKEQANFFGVYVREAHPADGWNMESNSIAGVKLNQPKTLEARVEVARTCATTLKYSMPLLVDTMDDRVGNLYSGMPSRAYVIDTNGKVTYQSGRGPFGFLPGELEQSLIMTILADTKD